WTARAGAQGKAISLVDESGAFSLEGVERFIGQRIRVEWAEDSMFLPEIRPTAEERRRYAAEREARRMGAVRGRGARDHRPGRHGPSGAAPPRPVEARREPGWGAEAAGAGRPRRRRRSGRRRRGGSGGPPAPAGPEAPPAG